MFQNPFQDPLTGNRIECVTVDGESASRLTILVQKGSRGETEENRLSNDTMQQNLKRELIDAWCGALSIFLDDVGFRKRRRNSRSIEL